MKNILEQGVSKGPCFYKIIGDSSTGIIFSEQLPGEGTKEADEMRALAKSLQGRGGGGGLKEVAHPTDSKGEGVAYAGSVPQIKSLGSRLEMKGFPQDRAAQARGTALISEPA